MRILWVCNIMLPMVARYLNKEENNKEGWLTGLADMILKNRSDNQIELAVAFPAQQGLCEKSIQVPVKYGSEEESGVLTCYGFLEDTAHPECYSKLSLIHI